MPARRVGDAVPVVELTTFDNDTGGPALGADRLQVVTRRNFTTRQGQNTPQSSSSTRTPATTNQVLCGGELCRETKFTIGPDGNIVDNGLVGLNKINSAYFLVPVKVVGTSDGQWQPMAWKTDAFYGNPLQGFTAP